MSLLEICQQLQNSGIGQWIHEDYDSVFGIGFYPVIETTHILALSISVGTILWFDLRALGLGMRQQRVSRVFAAVKPWMLAGFIVMFLTGALMFISDAEEFYLNISFRIKVIGLVLAAVNALYFHYKTQHGMEAWDDAPSPPLGVRLAGAFSILLWATIIAAGRMMAYTPPPM